MKKRANTRTAWSWKLLLVLVASFFTAASLYAAENTSQAATEIYCIGCHSPEVNPALHSIRQTPHGNAPGGGNAVCTQCHGDSIEHSSAPTTSPPSVSFGPVTATDSEHSNKQCLQCHQGEERIMWQSSAHHDEDIGCNQCHTAHASRDSVLNAAEQAGVCATCHTQIQAKLHLPSRHPILEGKTACSDCHNAHGSSSDFALLGTSLNDTCVGCHSEKRGPFLFEHAPVSEDCSLCHSAHGSVHGKLLTSRGPFLCQQCHSAAFHPSQLNDGSGLASGSANQNLLGKNCLNCHSQVHGSNHPSGGRLTR